MVVAYNIIILEHVTLYVYSDVGCICIQQSVLAVVHFHTSLPLAGLCTNALSPFVSPYVNVAVSGGYSGALVRKFAFSGGSTSGLVKKYKVHIHWNSVWCQRL